MIETDLGLQQSIEQLIGTYRVVLDLRRRIGSLNYAEYRTLAAGPLAETRQLQSQINQYLSGHATTEEALAEQAKIRELRGKLHWEGDLDAMRTDKRPDSTRQ